ncbi:MAG: anaerobic ribonucleoside-triphosphate reductase [Elusimicrobiota bacterium]|jgi:anaerobic ribonucleoside-triphosphate reductase|nr:anaerobic ribonucleoside-triphosphate reductase [Elusimicrobiota bacterium]
MSAQEIKEKIVSLQRQKEEVSGSKCEVYSRVVGYLRPVSLWNEGKREEFKARTCFKNVGK